MRHIGLFGGTFNPVHLGHLLAADAVRQQLKLDQIRFIPAAQSPFKDKPEISDQHRLMMLERALAAYPEFTIDPDELAKDGPSYTIDTLREKTAGQNTNRFYLLIGMDAWKEFENWRDWQAIMALCHLIVMTRPGYVSTRLGEFWQPRREQDLDTLRQAEAGKLAFLSVPPSNAASSDIRQRISQGKSLQKTLPESVHVYIREHGLYQNQG